MKSNTETRKIMCEQSVLEYQLIRKTVKNINLRIKSDGQIFVSANINVPIDFIDNFVSKKHEYILRALNRFEENRKYISNASRQYVSGESFDILGKSLRLKVIQGQQESVTTDGVFLFLTVRNKANLKRKENLMNNWLKETQMEKFDQICRGIYHIFEKYGVKYPTIKVRYMTSRWGSCQLKRGIITLNSKLIEAPRNSIEYVVLHEFAHFIHPNHSKKFYDFMAMLMPDWKERKKELDKRL